MISLILESYKYQSYIMNSSRAKLNSRPLVSQHHPYQDNLRSIKLMQESAIHGTPILLDDSMTDRDLKISRRAQRLLQASESEHPKYKNIQDFICQNINLEYQKYVKYDSGSQHSSEEQMELSPYNIEDMVAAANKDPVPGKITFIVKVIRDNCDYSFMVQNIRPPLHGRVLQVQLINSSQNFEIYEVDTSSIHKKIAIHMLVDQTSIASTKDISFSNRAILLDLNLSYDFAQEQPLRLNELQGLLVSCVIEGSKIANEVIELNGRKKFKQQLLGQSLQIDDITRKFINNNQKHRVDMINLLKYFLEEDDFQFGKLKEVQSKPTYQLLASLYLSEVLKFKPSVNGEEQNLSVRQTLNIFEIYLHIICLRQAVKIEIDPSEKIALYEKTTDIIHYCFQVKELKLFHQVIAFCLRANEEILTVGYDTINQYLTDYGISSPQFILTVFESITYQLNKGSIKYDQLAVVISQAFKKSKFQSKKIYDEVIKNVSKLSKPLFEQLELSQLTIDQFIDFYHVFHMFKSNPQLTNLVNFSALNQSIMEYVKEVKQNMRKSKDEEKVKAIRLFDMFFIKERFDELVTKELPVTNWIYVFIEANFNNDAILEILIEFYFQILKKTDIHFQEKSVINTSESICKTLSKLTAVKSLNFLNKYFKSQILDTEKYLRILTDCLLTPIINNWLPSNNKTVDLIDSGKNFQWHHEFKYQLYINELIVERIVKIVNIHMSDDVMGKNQLLRIIKNEIQNHIRDQEDRNTVKAIVEVQEIELSETKVWKYFTEQRGLLRTLKKILKKEDRKSEELMESLKNISIKLEKQQVSNEVISRIKKMKVNEWNVFVELTDHYDIPQFIDTYYEEGKRFTNYANSIKKFVREVGQKFNSPDAKKTITIIENYVESFEKESIKLKDLGSELPMLKQFKPEILKCYRIQSFYNGQDLKNKTIEQIIKVSHDLLSKLKKYLDHIVSDYQNKILKSSSLLYFKPQKQFENQFIQILNSNFDQITDTMDELIQIYKFLVTTKEWEELLRALTLIQDRKFGIKDPLLLEFYQICISLNKKEDFNIYGILQKKQKMKEKLEEYKLKVDSPESKEILQIFMLMNNHDQIDQLLKQIQPHLIDLKEKINDIGGYVTYDQLENCQTIIEFMNAVWSRQYDQLTDMIGAIIKFDSNKKQTNKSFKLLPSIDSVAKNIKNLKEEVANFLDSNRQTTKIMEEMVTKTKITFRLNQNCPDKIESVIEIFPDSVPKVISEREVMDTKEKGIMLLASANAERDKEKVKNIPGFLDVVKSLQTLKEKQQHMVDWGYRHFDPQPLEIEVVEANVNKLNEKAQEKEQKLQLWKTQVNKIYSNNYKAAHLQGKNIHNFYKFIQEEKEEQIPSNFLIINDRDEVHQDIKKTLKLKKGRSPQQCLQNLGKYFTELKKKEEINQTEAEDKDREFVHFKILPKDIDLIRGIQQLGKERVDKIKFELLLYCTKQTSNTQIKSFIERALYDANNQYVIMGYQNLDRKKQEYIVDQIKKKQKTPEQFKLKLCLVGDSQIELLYKFAKNSLTKPDEKNEKTLQQVKQAYTQTWRKATQRLLIVSSEQAGYGKSSKIIEHARKHGCVNQHYISLSGNMFVPSENRDEPLECEKFLWDQFSQMAERLKRAEKQCKQAGKPLDTCIIIEIYNIEPAVVDSVNKFIELLIVFKRYGYKSSYFAKLPQDVRIYVQLQNISPPANQRQICNGYPSQINTLTVFKELLQFCNKDKVLMHIKTFGVEDVNTTLNGEENIKLHIVLNYLKRLNYYLIITKDKSINPTQIEPFNIQTKLVPEKEARDLIKKFFFDKFDKNDKPSGYLWTYFKELLAAAVNKFSSSFFLSQVFLNTIDDNIKEVSKTVYQKLQLKKTFRYQFLEVLVQNCLLFSQRSVKPGNQNSEGSALQDTLKYMPFLIIPNANDDSFSFIYSQSDKVPFIIKAMIVLQEPSVNQQIINTKVQVLFETLNIAKLQKDNPAAWKEKASRILKNISGNEGYTIDQEPGYVVNIDNFFKICLISLRMRLNIPIVIMGEAGIGKTALLRHVVRHLYSHEFKVFNINAGLPLETPKYDEKGQSAKGTGSLKDMIENIRETYESMDKSKGPNGQAKKLWVFFDQFNTLKELGFFKQIIVDHRFLGQPQQHFKDIVLMAACNPHKKLKINSPDQTYVLKKEGEQKLAFDVLPAPHSLIESMWNYGSLNDYEYEKYVRNMLNCIDYKKAELTELILAIHAKIKKWLHESAVSLRDIERLRQMHGWFKQNLAKLKTTELPKILGAYNNKELRAVLMAIYFTYLLRFLFERREELELLIEEKMGLEKGYVRAAKEAEQNDFCSRLNLAWDTPLAINDALKENLYSCFVAVNTRLPLLIIGKPGSSKTLSLRLLMKNLGRTDDEYIKRFKSIRAFNIPGSENTVSGDIKKVFDNAHRSMIPKGSTVPLKLHELKDTLVVVFDQIGLAQKSPDNPLKVLHPYLEVDREASSDSRTLGFIGISNSELDVSKMSRLLILRRPDPTDEDLKYTALNIAQGYQDHQLDETVRFLADKLTTTYTSFLGIWQAKKNNYPLFYGLRDFYGLIKNFMSKIAERKDERGAADEDYETQCAIDSIFENFNGWQGSYHEMLTILYELLKIKQQVPHESMHQVINNLKAILSHESNRYPLVIAEDEQSMSFIKWTMEQHFKEKAIYMEGSPFAEDKQYSLKIIGEICRYMGNQFVLILSNLKEGVKTGLYDFFNKSFTLSDSTGKKYLKIQIGSNQGMQSFEYNPNFNCMYLLLSKDLGQVEPPFLSRFQKYRFSLKSYRYEKEIPLFQKVQDFGKRINTICQNNNLNHYTFNDLFINSNKKALESLALASYETVRSNHMNKERRMRSQHVDFTKQAYKEAIRRLILNSGQQFYYLFKLIIEKSGALPDVIELIKETIEYKNQNMGEKNLLIRFTNEPNYMKKFDETDHICLDFQMEKKESHFQDTICKFFKKENKKSSLCIFMKVLEHAKDLNYVLSQVQKIRKRAIAQKENIENKKVRIVYLFCRDKNDSAKQMSLTHFSAYTQEFDDGKVGDISGSKDQLFKTVIKMEELLNYAHKVFDFTFQNPETSAKSQKALHNILSQFETSKNCHFQQACQEVTTKLESNFQLSDDNMKEILADKEILNKFPSFKVAITRYFADKKLFGTIAVFIKYLIDKEAFLSYSNDFLYSYVAADAYELKDAKIDEFQRLKKSKNYSEFIKDMLKTRLNFILRDYQLLKQTKKLPNPQSKYQIKMCRPRLIPFSKIDCQKLLNCQEKELGWLAKQIYKNPEKINTTYQKFVEEFKEKTIFKNGPNNFYSKYIDQSNTFKEMLCHDLLLDFADTHGLSVKYVPKYYQLLRPLFGDGDKLKFTKMAKMASILLGFEEIWIEVFKLMSIFYEQQCDIPLEFKNLQATSLQTMKKYCQIIFTSIKTILLSQKCISFFGSADKYSRIYLNALFQMQKLQPLVEIQISGQLKSIRTSLIFLDIFDPNNKSDRIEGFIKEICKSKDFSHYHYTLQYFDVLNTEANEEQKKLVTEFKANTLFYEWFKKVSKQEEQKQCLEAFISNCQDQIFAHNSVATINHFISFLKPKYSDIIDCFHKFNNKNKQEGNVIEQLLVIGENSKKNDFKDNLSIVIINIFMQKINSEQKNNNILSKVKQFEEITNLISNQETYGLGKHFAFAFLKAYLEKYIDSLHNKEERAEFGKIDQILSKKDNKIVSNLRFFCLKLLRTKLPIKEVRQQYIKKIRCKWISLIQEINFFLQNQSRSIIIPKPSAKVSPKLLQTVQKVIDQSGKPDLFDPLFQEGCISDANKYHLFTFFFRYYFSLVYDYKSYKAAVVDKMTKEKAKYEKLVGELQFELLTRYVNNHFDQNVKIDAPEEFTEEKFFLFNPLNWLLATRNSISPITSLFLEKGQFHQNFKAAFDQLFFPCGPQNPFITIAQTQYELTRNNNVGVYICSAQCDYIYSHQNCGWPNETTKCRICGQNIGCKPGKGHTLSRDDQGARRIMSKLLVDGNGYFYVSSLSKQPHFFDAQRAYIEAEMNRMKQNGILTVGKEQVDIKGYNIENNGRVSTLTYYIFRQILHSLFYCLCSLKAIPNDQAMTIFNTKTAEQAKAQLLSVEQDDIKYLKKALNLDNKIYGWIYGIHHHFFDLSRNFQGHVASYANQVETRSGTLANQLLAQVNDSKVNKAYFQLYKDMANTLKGGLITRHVNSINDLTAKNRFTRDIFEELLERFIKANTTESKFKLSEDNTVLQGTMQFPNDSLLTEDKIDQGSFPFSRLLKLPDKVIKYSEIVVSFELQIREKYPFLDYVLKNSDAICSMFDFFTVLSFSNELFTEVENTYERKDVERMVGQFIKELKDKKQNSLHSILKDPQAAINAWNRLAKRLGTLQNNCTIVGKMNDAYSLTETPVKAFLIDNVSKTNPYGLILSSLYHNFAIMHNDLMNILNSRKNQIPQYKCLNLYNESKKVSPQRIRQKEVFFITEKELIDKLYEYSISSVSYGRNFIFTNFESYERYFLMKLQGKCEIMSIISDFKNICFNGQAFSQSSESSNTLNQIREYFYVPLNDKERKKVHRQIKQGKSPKEIAQCSVKVRGDIERIMITIRNLNGVVEEANISQFINKNELDCSSHELAQFGEFQVGKIVALYELVELEMKQEVLESLPEKYKQKLEPDIEKHLIELFQRLPTDDGEYSVSLLEFGQAVYRFMARNLLGGIMSEEKKIMEYIPYRQDFWPLGFQEYKLQLLVQDAILGQLSQMHICALFSILEGMIKKNVGASQI